MNPQPLSSQRRWLAFAALMLGLFTILSAATSVATALPSIERDLHASLSLIEWFVDGYLIALTVLMATFGRMGDIFGRKRLFVVGAAVFLVTSAACALSRDIHVLIVARALSGVGPAMMMSATLSLITDLFAPHERGMPLGIWGSMVGIGTGLGPVLGGLLVSDLGWQWVFWGNVVLAAITCLLALFLLPPSKVAYHRPSLDVPGVLLSAGFVFCLSFGLVEGNARGWSSPLILTLFGCSGAFLSLFILREVTARDPMLQLSLFREPAFSAGVFVTLLLSFCLLSLFVYMPLFLQGPGGNTALQSGLALLPLSVSIALVGPIGGWLSSRVENRWPILAAFVLIGSGLFWLSHLSISTTWQWLAPSFVLIGIGLGIASANLNTAVLSVVRRESAGSASGVVTTVRQLGSVLGIAVLGAVIQTRQSAFLSSHLPAAHTTAQRSVVGERAFVSALANAFDVTVAVCIAAALFALLIRQRTSPAKSSRVLSEEPATAAE